MAEIFGTNGDDLYEGTSEDDLLVASSGDDTLEGSGGEDIVNYSVTDFTSGIFVNNTGLRIDGIAPFTADKRGSGTDVLSSIEVVVGSQYEDTIYTNENAVTVYDRAGDDRVFGTTVLDPDTAFVEVVAGSGDDTYTGSVGNFDTIYYGVVEEDAGGRISQGVIVDLADGTATDGWGDSDSIDGFESVFGTRFGDELGGSEGRDLLFGEAGADSIFGGDGADVLSGGEGADVIDGEGGDADEVEYRDDPGGVTVDLAAGKATDGWGAEDDLRQIEYAVGSSSDDVIMGNDLANRLRGDAGADSLTGVGGADDLHGGDGSDTLRGGADNDLLRGNQGEDTLDGGDGDADRAVYWDNPSGVQVNLDDGTATDGWGDTDRLIAIEQVEGSDFGDTLIGANARENTLRGEGGNDSLVGGDNRDNLSGDAGDDTLIGASGSGYFEPGPGTDKIVGNDGSQGANEISYIFETFRDPSITAGMEVTFTGEFAGTIIDYAGDTDTFTGIQRVRGTSNDDTITGAEGNQQIWLFGGDDSIDLGAGDRDEISYTRVRGDFGAMGGADVDMEAGIATDPFGGTDTFADVEVVTGSAFADTLRGSSGDDGLQGRDGDDLLEGRDGDDYLDGGDGSDTLDGGEGIDTAGWAGATGDYIVTLGSLTVTEKGEGGASDVVKNMEFLRFADGFEFAAEGAIDFRFIEAVQTVSAEDLTALVEMYIAYFNRAPDSLGLFYWGTRLTEQMTPEGIAESFFVQDESLATFPDVNDNAALVDAAYNNLLERDADEEGRAYWIDALEQDDVSRAEFMLALINGAKAETGSAADAKVVADKGKIGLDYAVINGLNDVGNAAAAMAAYDRDAAAASLAEAAALIDGYRAAAEAGDEIIVELTGVVEDPFA